MIIRTEMPMDYEEVYALVKAAFETNSDSDGSEPEYLDELRSKDTFVPELSLVAVEDGRIVGQIMFSKMQITCGEEKITQLVISPIAVHPTCFRQGICTKLIAEGCKKAMKLGYKAVFLCGNVNYYSRLGFVPTFKYGIYHVNDEKKNADWCMAAELERGYLRNLPEGTVDIE